MKNRWGASARFWTAAAPWRLWSGDSRATPAPAKVSRVQLCHVHCAIFTSTVPQCHCWRGFKARWQTNEPSFHPLFTIIPLVFPKTIHFGIKIACKAAAVELKQLFNQKILWQKF
jgi:hypothetical protein